MITARREFLKNTLIGTAAACTGDPFSVFAGIHPGQTAKAIRIDSVASNFEREPLIRPFGFKGGYMTEMWQTAAKIHSSSGIERIGICTQNVLYADADVFAAHSEAAGNRLMYSVTDKALQLSKQLTFTHPIELIDQLLPGVYEEAKKLTSKKELNKIFVLNALVGIDNAAWLVYAAENGFKTFDKMIPAPYQTTLSHHNSKVAIIYLASYGLPLTELKQAAKDGYFVLKIKIGQPGTQDEMLEKDKARLHEIHQAVKEERTNHTANGKLIYTLDANGRYEKKDTLLRLLDHAKKIGAYEQILFIEEPLSEQNDENVSDVGIRIAADESAHDEQGTIRRLDQGYGALALKGIAKTLSISMKMAKLAHERNIPCLCADLTVNPILVDWHKNLAARIAPFPGLDMGIMETNGHLNYSNWQKMESYHPRQGALWTKHLKGIFELDKDFYDSSGGIFERLPHYEAMFK